MEQMVNEEASHSSAFGCRKECFRHQKHLVILILLIVITGSIVNFIYLHWQNNAKDIELENLKLGITENMEKLLSQKYLLVAKENSEQISTKIKNRMIVDNPMKNKREEIMNRFQTTIPLPENSAAYKILKEKLELSLNNIDEEIKATHQAFNLTLIKYKEQVLHFYQEEFSRATSKPPGSELINSQISYEAHDKVANTVISKCVHNKLIPANFLVQHEMKVYLDDIYEKKVNDEITIGIDFVDNCARAAVYFREEIIMIPHYTQNGTVRDCIATYLGVDRYNNYVGQSAQELVESSLVHTPFNNTIEYFVSRRYWTDSYGEGWYFNSSIAVNTTPIVFGETNLHPLHAVLLNLFRKIRENSEKHLGIVVKACVISLPDYFFREMSGNFIVDTARLAGFSRINYVDEPSAAAFALQYKSSPWTSERKVLVITFTANRWIFYAVDGSKTFFRRLNVKSYLGGKEIRENLMNHCIEKFAEAEHIDKVELLGDNSENRVRKRRLIESCEKGISYLSTHNQTSITVMKFYKDKNLTINVTRSDFERINVNSFNNIVTFINTLRTNHNASEIIITGHYSKIPKVIEKVQSAYAGKVLTVPGISSENTLVYGAAVKAAILSADSIRATASQVGL